MAKPRSKYVEPEKVKAHPLIDFRALLVDHMVWQGCAGSIVTVYNDGSVMLFLDRNFHAKGKPTEFELSLWKHKNQPAQDLKSKKN